MCVHLTFGHPMVRCPFGPIIGYQNCELGTSWKWKAYVYLFKSTIYQGDMHAWKSMSRYECVCKWFKLMITSLSIIYLLTYFVTYNSLWLKHLILKYLPSLTPSQNLSSCFNVRAHSILLRCYAAMESLATYHNP